MDPLKPNQLNDKGPKERLAPYKLYVFLLDAQIEGIKRVGSWRVFIETGPLARKFRCRHSRIHDWLNWLESAGFLTILNRNHGEWELSVRKPKITID